ncbi:hypothetical protein KRP22_006322 [Phytophthora ramorum]|nr:hypothetical protein KRP22_2545 [Phytophthora ramorum]
MADMERAGTGGTKRKHKENAFTAKAESGTLKVKILRRDQKPGERVGVTASTSSIRTRPGRAPKQPPPPSDSPPKPRPNRKHVPIFYEPQFRQPIKRGGSHSSSTDESVTHSTSSTGVPGIHSTSSTDVAESSATSSSSSFVAQLSDVRLQSASTSGGDIGPPPRTNPLFERNDSDGLGTLGDLLGPYFPSRSGLQPRFPLDGSQPRTTSSAGLLADQPGLTSALHQLASSSASYRTALDALSARESSTSAADVPPTDTAGAIPSAASTTSDVKHNGATGGLETYRFDPFTALQTAIDHARRSSSTNVSAGGGNDKHREIGSPNSNARFYRLEPSGSSAVTPNRGNSSASDTTGPPPERPPAFTLQNSLMGGGIHSFISSKLPVEANNAKGSISSDEIDGKSATSMTGPPSEAPPSFFLQNLLVGGDISMSKLPKAHLSLDRLGSLTSLISQANEATKDLHTSLESPPKAHLSLERLVSLTSVTSEDGEIGKPGMKSTVSARDMACSSAPSSAADGAQSDNVADLGPPPCGPPAFTIGNSLMGGGIDLQPAAANVNTQDFDWKLHRSASSSGGDANSTAGGISHGLRARLERKLASSGKSEQLRQDK